jgi:hypothetical protein
MVFRTMKRLYFFFVLVTFVACTPDRTFAPPPAQPPIGGSNDIRYGTLRINEFMATGSPFYNELVIEGVATSGSDWLELFNTTNDTIQLEEGRWFVTDSIGDPEGWELPDTVIFPRGFLVIWCDDFDTTITQMHSNFRLSGGGEQLGLFYNPADAPILAIDTLTFATQFSGQSQARFPDGTINWIISSNPTPNAANEE